MVSEVLGGTCRFSWLGSEHFATGRVYPPDGCGRGRRCRRLDATGTVESLISYAIDDVVREVPMRGHSRLELSDASRVHSLAP